MTEMQLVTDVRAPANAWAPQTEDVKALAQQALSFLDTASTAFGRATAYNDREQNQSAELAVHDALLKADRGLYALLLTLPGVTDRARQVGVKNLLGVTGPSTVGPEVERRVLGHLVAELPATRVFKLFIALRAGDEKAGIHRANNARTRKLILRVILGSPRIELWAVKYRTKMAEALTHAWGARTTSILRAVLAKPSVTWTTKEQAIVGKAVDKFAAHVDKARACVAFVLRVSGPTPTLPLLAAYEAAKTDLAAGRRLPLEVLEGIRSTFHKDVKTAGVLSLAKDSLTTAQRMQVQRRAEEAGVEVRFDPTEYDAVRLYLYAFERGMTPEIGAALLEKARKAALALRLGYARIGILLDASASMAGSKEQPLRPMATALAVRDVLMHASRSVVLVSGGVMSGADELLVRPAGATSLAEGLVELLRANVEAVFVLSDGYENRPAGRFAEVLAAVRGMGVQTPIFHLNPVFAQETRGVRPLTHEGSEHEVATLPVATPEALGLAFIRGLLIAEPRRGLEALAALAVPMLGGPPSRRRCEP